jgi:hypothetical protein
MPLRRGHALWISLFAMLMVFAGPLISQSMPMGNAHGMDMPMHHGGKHAGAHAVAQLSQSPPRADLHPIWEKCGYCNLMLHCPALPQTLTLLNAPAGPEPRAQHYFTRAGYARPAIFAGALTRAPPLPLLA